MKTSDKTLIWHLDVRRKTLQLLRVTLNEFTTRLDFGYQMDQMYVNNWWINIDPNTHLLTSASTKKFRMQDQLNIATAPNKNMYKARTDWQFFSLFFAPLPQEDQKISLIEFETATRTGFNMYDIELKLSDAFIMK